MRLRHALILSLGLIPTAAINAQTSAPEQTQNAAQPAQATGTVAGKVVDSETGKGLSGVSVSISEGGQYATTDVNGNYSIPSVPEGTCTVTFYKGGYQYSSAEGLEVRQGEVSRLDFPMQARATEDVDADSYGSDDIVMLDAITVVAESTKDSQIGLQQYREKALNISDAIGAEDFSKQGLGDAAEAMSRVTGASVMGGKYVLIRGLGDRYANTLMNGVGLPSADPDKRAVQMDQFPTELLESIQTSKSFTPDQPGDFAGGSVNIRTKSFPDAYFMTVSASIGYNTNVTGSDILSSYEGVSWTAMDAGDRWAPATPEGLTLPQTAYTRARSGSLDEAETLAEFSSEFQHSMMPKTVTGMPNYSFSVATGDQFKLGKEQKLGCTFSFTYDHKTTGFDNGYLASYLDPDTAKFVYSPNQSDYSFADLVESQDLPWGKTKWGYSKSVQSVNWGVYTKIAWQPSADNEITLDLYHNQYAEDEVQRGIGVQPQDYPSMIYENYSMLYTERGMTSAQLHGKHVFSNLLDGMELDWSASLSRSTQKQPDYRILQTLYDLTTEEYSTNTTYAPSRFFRDLDELGQDYSMDLTVPLHLFGMDGSNLKFGGLFSTKSRTYKESQYTLYYGRSTGKITSYEQELTAFTDDTIGILSTTESGSGYLVNFGWTVYPTNTNVSNYTGEQDIGAGYAMADILLPENFRLIAGARAERTGLNVKTYSADDDTLSDEGDISQTDALPAASLIYTIRDGMNLRLAYGRTLARPTFKELTSARLYDPFRREYYQGNPDLEITNIDNLDLRWEWFLNKGQMVAASAFYKHMDNPIEVMFRDSSDTGSSTGTIVISPMNRDEAEVMGLETEVRFSLAGLSSWLEDFVAGANASLINSSVTGGEYHSEEIPDSTLVGQSHYVVNCNLTYQNFNSGTVLTLLANMVGERLVAFTPPDDELPNVYEKPPVTLNFVASQRIGHGVTLKFSASNLLDSKYERTYGKSSDLVAERYRNGRTFTLGVTYNF